MRLSGHVEPRSIPCRDDLVVASFAHMDFGKGHVSSPLIAVTVSRIDLRDLN